MSRELSTHEQDIAKRRRAQLEEFRAAAPDMLEQLGDRLGLDPGVVVDASSIDACLRGRGEELMVDPALRVWWLTRVGAWVAQELCASHQGLWFVDPDPEARTFLRAVVGRFGGRKDGPRYDPMQVASVVVDGGESLARWLSAIEDELHSH